MLSRPVLAYQKKTHSVVTFDRLLQPFIDGLIVSWLVAWLTDSLIGNGLVDQPTGWSLQSYHRFKGPNLTCMTGHASATAEFTADQWICVQAPDIEWGLLKLPQAQRCSMLRAHLSAFFVSVVNPRATIKINLDQSSEQKMLRVFCFPKSQPLGTVSCEHVSQGHPVLHGISQSCPYRVASHGREPCSRCSMVVQLIEHLWFIEFYWYLLWLYHNNRWETR